MESSFETDGVRGVLHRPDSPGGDGLVLTHGAGSDCHAPLLASLARAFAGAGYVVLRYDLPFRRQRPKGPPYPAAAARDREGVVRAIAEVRKLAPGRVIAGGQSYGGRQTAMIAAEQPALADALLLLSYPLHAPATPEKKRTAFFSELHQPVLFVHGAADPFGTLEEIRAAMELISAPTGLLPVERSGHDLKRAADLFPEIHAQLRALMVA
jgi:uncharacterized protein